MRRGPRSLRAIPRPVGLAARWYRHPIRCRGACSGPRGAGRSRDQGCPPRGGYRRSPTPVVELRDIVAADGLRSRSWQWAFDYLVAAGAALLGVLVIVA